MSEGKADSWNLAEDLFRQALELPEDQRGAFLADICAERPAVRTEVEQLLAAHADAEHFLETPAGGALPPGADTAVGSRIAGFVIRRHIATGGMGTVYEAEQQNPRRTVALKIMRRELVTPSARRRFEFEGHVLGRLQHEGIARIFQAGIAETDAGAIPYFAMEMVRGRPLTRYADEEKLRTRDRLRLIVQVCEAVHHAHLHGIVHRDLKPDNVLVDDSGRVKVLDFGIARTTDADVQATTLRTDVGQLMGTLAYMSPEQVAGDPAAVDFRSDVYALGVMCYELLTGALPRDVSGKSIPEAVRTLQEEEPRRLSTVNRVFRGDLDTIVAKALETDKARRYASASELGADLQRFLQDEPIIARPTGTFYQFRKFVRRHRVGVAFAATILLLLVGGVATTTTQAVRAKWAEREARKEAETAKAVTTFLTETLSSADPFRDGGAELTVREALDAASARLKEELEDQPEVRAAVHESIGETYRHLGAYESAEKHLREALDTHARLFGEDHPRSVTSRLCLAALHADRSEYDEARRLMEQVFEQRRRALGPEHEATLNAMINLSDVCHEAGDEATAIDLARRAMESFRRAFGENHHHTLSAMNNLAIYLHTYGRLHEARPLLEQALKGRRAQLGDDHPKTLITMDNLGVLLNDLGEREEAERLVRESLAGFERTLGEEHFETLRALNNLGLVLHQGGKLEEAEQVYRRELAISERALGEDHLDTLGSYNNFANFLADRGQLAEAETFMRKARQGVVRKLGTDNRYFAFTCGNLATILDDQGKHAEAEALHREAVATAEAVFPPDHPRLAKMRVAYGRCLTNLGRFEDAEAQLSGARAALKDTLGHDHELYNDAEKALAQLRQARGGDDQAEDDTQIPVEGSD